jgi:hypothetical protein
MRTLAFLLWVALVGLVATPRDAAAQSWQRYQSPEGFFSVMLPKAPTTKSAPVDTNGAVTQYDYLASLEPIAYQVTVLVFGSGSNTPVASDAYWTRVLQGYAKGSGSVLRSQRPIVIAGQNGIEGLSDDAKTDLHHRIDLFIAGNRLYFIVAAGPGNFPASADAARYFNSFQIPQ